MGLLAQRLAALSVAQGSAAISPIPNYTQAPVFDPRTGTGLMGFVGNIGADARDIALGLGRLGGIAVGDVRDIVTGNLEDVDVFTPTFAREMVKAFGKDIADRYVEPAEIPQQMYDPDRIKVPMKRTNPAKGALPFTSPSQLWNLRRKSSRSPK